MQAQLELLCLCSPNVTTEQFLKMLVKRAVPVLGEDLRSLMLAIDTPFRSPLCLMALLQIKSNSSLLRWPKGKATWSE
jgi:hypothetical protein